MMEGESHSTQQKKAEERRKKKERLMSDLPDENVGYSHHSPPLLLSRSLWPQRCLSDFSRLATFDLSHIHFDTVPHQSSLAYFLLSTRPTASTPIVPHDPLCARTRECATVTNPF